MIPLKNKKGFIPLLIIVLVLLVSTGIISLSNFSFASLSGYSSVYKANWGSIECLQQSDYDVKDSRWLDQATIFKCDDYTNECRFSLEQSPSLNLAQRLLLSTSYKICYLNGVACSSSVIIPTLQSGEYRTIVSIPVGREIHFSSNYGSNIRVIKEAKSFYIKGRENGKIFVQESCKLNNDLLSKVLRTSNGALKGGLNELSFNGANSYQNYLIDFIQVATQTYLYSGQEVICQSRQLSKVEVMDFLDGTPKRIQGDIIKSVECCPTEANCGEDFKFKSTGTIKQCTFSTECPNGGNPVATSGTSYVTYQCIQGSCVKSTDISTECTNTATCINKHGSNSVCDLSYNNFGKCITNTKPNFCGDSMCNSIDGENAQTCPADCVSGYLNNSMPWYLWALLIINVLLLMYYRFRLPVWGWALLIVSIFIFYQQFLPSIKQFPFIGWLFN